MHLFLSLFITLKIYHQYGDPVMAAELQSNFTDELLRITLRATGLETSLPCLQESLDPCSSLPTLLFRSIDGSCNNRDLRRPSTRLARLLPPAYGDGKGSPRNSSVLSSCLPLPSPRIVSLAVHPDSYSTTNLTSFFVSFGQFIDHETVSTPVNTDSILARLRCCGNGTGPPGQTDSECFPIFFPPNDTHFQGTCMEFMRSQPVRDLNNNIVYPRENTNVITSFVDASTVYGSTSERLQFLRDPEKPYLLLTTKDDNFLPFSSVSRFCLKRKSTDYCPAAGDDRLNTQPGLTLLHTVFTRYHNLIASELRSLSPTFSDELVFQQARAVVAAVMQNILYSEWLPIVLGPKVRREFDLDFQDNRTEFNPDIDPRIFQAFSTAAFRFGHSLIPRSVAVTPSRHVPLRELFFKSYEARENLDSMTEGFLKGDNPGERAQPADRFMVEEVTGHLFENIAGFRQGFDLASLNIQRGRDHGLPPYNAFRQAVGLPKVKFFDDPVLGEAGARLDEVYAHVDDIDLFSGGLSEAPHDGGLTGQTFSRLIALQFYRLKFGDRFFFSHGKSDFGFTNTRYRLIRGITLAHLLCRTAGISRVQRNAFRVVDQDNEEMNCEDISSEHPSMSEFTDHPW